MQTNPQVLKQSSKMRGFTRLLVVQQQLLLLMMMLSWK